jgi:hypothetical protein
VLEIVWLADLLTSRQQQPQPGSANSSSSTSVLSLVPGSVLSDAAAWLTFVIQQGQSEQLAAVPIGESCYQIKICIFVTCLITGRLSSWLQCQSVGDDSYVDAINIT